MKSNEKNNAEVMAKSAKETAKESYVKPAMEVYEMELEGVIMGASGNNWVDNGGYGRRSQPASSGLPWDKYSSKHE